MPVGNRERDLWSISWYPPDPVFLMDCQSMDEGRELADAARVEASPPGQGTPLPETHSQPTGACTAVAASHQLDGDGMVTPMADHGKPNLNPINDAVAEGGEETGGGAPTGGELGSSGPDGLLDSGITGGGSGDCISLVEVLAGPGGPGDLPGDSGLVELSEGSAQGSLAIGVDKKPLATKWVSQPDIQSASQPDILDFGAGGEGLLSGGPGGLSLGEGVVMGDLLGVDSMGDLLGGDAGISATNAGMLPSNAGMSAFPPGFDLMDAAAPANLSLDDTSSWGGQGGVPLQLDGPSTGFGGGLEGDLLGGFERATDGGGVEGGSGGMDGGLFEGAAPTSGMPAGQAPVDPFANPFGDLPAELSSGGGLDAAVAGAGAATADADAGVGGGSVVTTAATDADRSADVSAAEGPQDAADGGAHGQDASTDGAPVAWAGDGAVLDEEAADGNALDDEAPQDAGAGDEDDVADALGGSMVAAPSQQEGESGEGHDSGQWGRPRDEEEAREETGSEEEGEAGEERGSGEHGGSHVPAESWLEDRSRYQQGTVTDEGDVSPGNTDADAADVIASGAPADVSTSVAFADVIGSGTIRASLTIHELAADSFSASSSNYDEGSSRRGDDSSLHVESSWRQGEEEGRTPGEGSGRYAEGSSRQPDEGVGGGGSRFVAVSAEAENGDDDNDDDEEEEEEDGVGSAKGEEVSGPEEVAWGGGGGGGVSRVELDDGVHGAEAAAAAPFAYESFGDVSVESGTQEEPVVTDASDAIGVVTTASDVASGGGGGGEGPLDGDYASETPAVNLLMLDSDAAPPLDCTVQEAAVAEGVSYRDDAHGRKAQVLAAGESPGHVAETKHAGGRSGGDGSGSQCEAESLLVDFGVRGEDSMTMERLGVGEDSMAMETPDVDLLDGADAPGMLEGAGMVEEAGANSLVDFGALAEEGAMVDSGVHVQEATHQGGASDSLVVFGAPAQEGVAKGSAAGLFMDLEAPVVEAVSQEPVAEPSTALVSGLEASLAIDVVDEGLVSGEASPGGRPRVDSWGNDVTVPTDIPTSGVAVAGAPSTGDGNGDSSGGLWGGLGDSLQGSMAFQGSMPVQGSVPVQAGQGDDESAPAAGDELLSLPVRQEGGGGDAVDGLPWGMPSHAAVGDDGGRVPSHGAEDPRAEEGNAGDAGAVEADGQGNKKDAGNMSNVGHDAGHGAGHADHADDAGNESIDENNAGNVGKDGDVGDAGDADDATAGDVGAMAAGALNPGGLTPGRSWEGVASADAVVEEEGAGEQVLPGESPDQVVYAEGAVEEERTGASRGVALLEVSEDRSEASEPLGVDPGTTSGGFAFALVEQTTGMLAGAAEEMAAEEMVVPSVSSSADEAAMAPLGASISVDPLASAGVDDAGSCGADQPARSRVDQEGLGWGDSLAYEREPGDAKEPRDLMAATNEAEGAVAREGLLLLSEEEVTRLSGDVPSFPRSGSGGLLRDGEGSYPRGEGAEDVAEGGTGVAEVAGGVILAQPRGVEGGGMAWEAAASLGEEAHGFGEDVRVPEASADTAPTDPVAADVAPLDGLGTAADAGPADQLVSGFSPADGTDADPTDPFSAGFSPAYGTADAGPTGASAAITLTDPFATDVAATDPFAREATLTDPFGTDAAPSDKFGTEAAPIEGFASQEASGNLFSTEGSATDSAPTDTFADGSDPFATDTVPVDAVATDASSNPFAATLPVPADPVTPDAAPPSSTLAAALAPPSSNLAAALAPPSSTLAAALAPPSSNLAAASPADVLGADAARIEGFATDAVPSADPFATAFSTNHRDGGAAPTDPLAVAPTEQYSADGASADPLAEGGASLEGFDTDAAPSADPLAAYAAPLEGFRTEAPPDAFAAGATPSDPFVTGAAAANLFAEEAAPLDAAFAVAPPAVAGSVEDAGSVGVARVVSFMESAPTEAHHTAGTYVTDTYAVGVSAYTSAYTSTAYVSLFDDVAHGAASANDSPFIPTPAAAMEWAAPGDALAADGPSPGSDAKRSDPFAADVASAVISRDFSVSLEPEGREADAMAESPKRGEDSGQEAANEQTDEIGQVSEQAKEQANEHASERANEQANEGAAGTVGKGSDEQDDEDDEDPLSPAIIHIDDLLAIRTSVPAEGGAGEGDASTPTAKEQPLTPTDTWIDKHGGSTRAELDFSADTLGELKINREGMDEAALALSSPLRHVKEKGWGMAKSAVLRTLNPGRKIAEAANAMRSLSASPRMGRMKAKTNGLPANMSWHDGSPTVFKRMTTFDAEHPGDSSQDDGEDDGDGEQHEEDEDHEMMSGSSGVDDVDRQRELEARLDAESAADDPADVAVMSLLSPTAAGAAAASGEDGSSTFLPSEPDANNASNADNAVATGTSALASAPAAPMESTARSLASGPTPSTPRSSIDASKAARVPGPDPAAPAALPPVPDRRRDSWVAAAIDPASMAPATPPQLSGDSNKGASKDKGVAAADKASPPASAPKRVWRFFSWGRNKDKGGAGTPVSAQVASGSKLARPQAEPSARIGGSMDGAAPAALPQRPASDRRRPETRKFEDALRANPRDYDAYYNWGLMLQVEADRALGQGSVLRERRSSLLAEACMKYEAATSISPDFHEAFYNWGMALSDRAKMATSPEQQRQLYLAACDKYEASLRSNWNSPQALNNWGLALQDVAQSEPTPAARVAVAEKSVDKFRAALRLRGDFHKAVYNLGTVLFGRAEDVRQHFKGAEGYAYACELYSMAAAYLAIAHCLKPQHAIYKTALSLVHAMLPLPYLKAGFLHVSTTVGTDHLYDQEQWVKRWIVLGPDFLQQETPPAPRGPPGSAPPPPPPPAHTSEPPLHVLLLEVLTVEPTCDLSLPPGGAAFCLTLRGFKQLYLIAESSRVMEGWVDAIKLVQTLLMEKQSHLLRQILTAPPMAAPAKK
eukprot:jgi/Mesvir1/7884/Mv11817-RA.1